MERIAVIDFETTGITPSSHCRATEIAVVILERGQIVDRYQSLMNAGVRVPGFIEQPAPASDSGNWGNDDQKFAGNDSWGSNSDNFADSDYSDDSSSFGDDDSFV